MTEHKSRAWQDWMMARAREGPLLLVVDDLHWADTNSVELIGDALRAARDLPVVVIAFARPSVRDQFPALESAWDRQEIPLGALRPKPCEQLIRAALGEDIAAERVHQLVERSGGNAFYLEELIRAAAAGPQSELPQTVLASARMRIERLPANARQVLRAASIFGRTFWARGVAALLRQDQSPAEIYEWLVQLERAEIIVRHDAPGLAAGAGRGVDGDPTRPIRPIPSLCFPGHEQHARQRSTTTRPGRPALR